MIKTDYNPDDDDIDRIVHEVEHKKKEIIKPKIPIEFLPGFWVTEPQGLSGRGSGFLLAENIKSVFSVDTKIPQSQDSMRNWNILNISQSEVAKDNYLEAFIQIITESWLETNSIIIVGSKWCIERIVLKYLVKVGGMKEQIAMHVLRTKID